jgi:hypothetical protein
VGLLFYELIAVLDEAAFEAWAEEDEKLIEF